MRLCLKDKENYISEITKEDIEVVQHNMKFGVYNHIGYEEYKDILNKLLDKQIAKWQTEDKDILV